MKKHVGFDHKVSTDRTEILKSTSVYVCESSEMKEEEDKAHVALQVSGFTFRILIYDLYEY